MNALEKVLTAPQAVRLAITLVHFLWQGALVAILLGVALRLLRRRSANVRYVFATAGLLVLAALPVATFLTVGPPEWAQGLVETSRHAPAPEGAPGAAPSPRPRAPQGSDRGKGQIPSAGNEAGAADNGAIRPTTPPPARIAYAPSPWRQRLAPVIRLCLPYVSAAWCLGVLVMFLWRVAGWSRVRRMTRDRTRDVPRDLRVRFKELADRLGVAGPVRLLESATAGVPTLIGCLRPVLLLPAAMLSGLSPEQLSAILAHELAHIRRRDYLVNLFQVTVETLLFYHPAVWWLSRRIRAEREDCCDDVAVAASGDRIAYARALASMEELRAAPAVALAASGGSLLARVRRIVGLGTGDDTRRSGGWAIVPGGLAGLLIAGMILFGGGPAGVSQASAEAIATAGAQALAAGGDEKTALKAIERIKKIAIEAKKYELGIQTLEGIARATRSPGIRAAALHAVADLYLKQGKPAEAIEALAKLVGADGRKPAPTRPPPHRKASSQPRPKGGFEETFDDNKNWQFNGNYAKPNFADYPGITGWENGTRRGEKHPKGRAYLNIVDGVVSGCSRGYGDNPQSFEPTTIHRSLKFDGSSGFCLEFRAVSAANWPNAVTVYLLSDWERGKKKLKYYGFTIYGESSNHTIDIMSTALDSSSKHLYRYKAGRLVNSWHTYTFKHLANGEFQLFVDGKRIDSFRPPRDSAYKRFNRIAINAARKGSKIDWVRLSPLEKGPPSAKGKPRSVSRPHKTKGAILVGDEEGGDIKNDKAGWDGDFGTFTEAASNGNRLRGITWETTEIYRIPENAKNVRLHAKVEHANRQSHAGVYVYNYVEEEYELKIGGEKAGYGVHEQTVPLSAAHVRGGEVKVRALMMAKQSRRAYARYYESEILHGGPTS